MKFYIVFEHNKLDRYQDCEWYRPKIASLYYGLKFVFDSQEDCDSIVQAVLTMSQVCDAVTNLGLLKACSLQYFMV